LTVPRDMATEVIVDGGYSSLSFSWGGSYSVGSDPYSYALGDINGDGKIDIATANHGAASASVILNSGGGSFGSAVSYSVGASPTWIQLGDVNADGAPDIFTSNYDSNNVSMLLSTPSGYNTSAIPVGTNPHSLVLTDLDGD